MLVGVLANILAKYDKDLGVSEGSGKHVTANMDKDKRIVLQQLVEAAVFTHVNNQCFPNKFTVHD